MPTMPLPRGEWGLQSEPLPEFNKTWHQAQADVGAQWQKDRRRQQMEMALRQQDQMQTAYGPQQRRELMMDQLMSQRAARDPYEMPPSAIAESMMGLGEMGAGFGGTIRSSMQTGPSYAQLIEASGGRLNQSMLDYIRSIWARGESSLSTGEWEHYQNILGEKEMAEEAIRNNQAGL